MTGKGKFKLLSLLLFMFVSSKIWSQDPGFTQFYANPLYLNPAFAGSSECPSIRLAYRNQWPGLANAYTTYSISFDRHVKSLSGGVGFIAARDEQGNGAINMTNIGAMYAYHFKAGKNLNFRLAGQATLYQKDISTNNLVFPDMISSFSGELTTTGENVTSGTDFFADYSAGFIGYTDKIYFGVAAHHLTEQKAENEIGEYYILPRKYTAHLGFNIPVSSYLSKNKFEVSPNIVYQKQLEFEKLNYGFYFSWNSITIGFWARQNLGIELNSVNLLLGYYTKQFKIGYSYDYPLNEIQGNFTGAHEITLQYRFPCKKKKEYKAISCPKF